MIENLVSTLIPVHNRGALVREAVESVLAQSYRPIECIVVDDGSTDDTPAVLEDLAARYPDEVRIIRKANSGPGPSREAGRQVARGEFIQYLDSDDLLAPGKFAEQVAALRADPQAALCYGVTEYYRLGEEANRKAFADTDQPVAQIFPAFLVRRRWGTSTPLYRRSVVDKIGPWGAMWAEEDWEYDCRIGALCLAVLHVNSVVSYQRGVVGKRLSQQGRDDMRTLASRAEARTKIYEHALHAGMQAGMPEMDWFLRSLFLLARDCGGAGLVHEAINLCDMVRHGTDSTSLKLQVSLYRRVAAVAGWANASKAARLFEPVRLLIKG